MLLQQQCASLTAARPTADAVIVNYNLGIKEMFEEYGHDKDILFSKDYGGASIINAGDHSTVAFICCCDFRQQVSQPLHTWVGRFCRCTTTEVCSKVAVSLF